MADAAPPPKEAQADTAAAADDDAGAAVAEAAIEAPYIIQPVDPKIFGDSVELLSTGFIGTVMPTIDDLAAQLEEIMCVARRPPSPYLPGCPAVRRAVCAAQKPAGVRGCGGVGYGHRAKGRGAV